MENIKRIRLFISCPSDIKEELDSINFIVNRINKTHGSQNYYLIDILNWNIDTYTQIGADGQDVINQQFDDKYDILVGLMWMRIGSPTKRDKSGTIEEINRAINSSEKEQLIYFKTESPENLNDIDLGEYSKVKDFKNELVEKGVLYKEYKSIKSFENLFEIHLPQIIFERVINQKKKPISSLPKKDKSDEKYSRIVELSNEVRNKDSNELELDIFKTTESATSYLHLVTNSLNSMTDLMQEWTQNLTKRNTEMISINNIRDERLRIAKQKTVINLLAKETSDFNQKIENELPLFTENFMKVGPSYSKVFLIINKFSMENKEADQLKESALNLRENVEKSLESIASLIETLMSFPPLNMNFNKAKRALELTLNELMTETLEGLKLLDDALGI